MRRKDESQERQPGDPTPEEIRQACLAIQATWSEAERARRRAMIPSTPKPRGKAAFAHARLEHEREEARKRQEASQAKPGQRVGGGNISTTLDDNGKSRDKAGAAVGISGKSVEKYDKADHR